MARIRSVKPEFFRHEGLQDLEAANLGKYPMMVFEALWGHCDKAGRFRWKPRTLKLDILPFLQFDMAETLELLRAAGFVRRYVVGDEHFGFVPTFEEHQRVSGKEAQEPAIHPDPESGSVWEAVGKHPVGQEGKGREEEGNGMEAREKSRASPKVHQPSSSKPSSQNQKALRWPADAIVPDEWLTLGEAARGRHGMPTIDLRLEAEKFANYWASRERDAAKSDWLKTWINWCLKAEQNGGRAGKNGQGSGHPFGVFGAILEKERRRELAQTVEDEAEPH